MHPRPLLALTLGDPAGIGPEIVLGALANPAVRAVARFVLIGHPDLRRDFQAAWKDSVSDAQQDEWKLGVAGRSICEDELPPDSVNAKSFAGALAQSFPTGEFNCTWVDVETPGGWSMAAPQAIGGRAALAALRVGAALAQAGVVDALVTAPVSKEALHLAGEKCEGQTELLGRWAGTPDLQMLAIAKNLRVLLLTRHLPLKIALARIEPELVLRHLQLLHDGLRSLGFERPRLALAGLNPHAGEAGILGREELDLLAPALAQARASGLDVSGPESPDTVFYRASTGRFDGVLALYHDQAFIPVKLHAPDDGLTVLLGLPYLRVSPAHGTAFDIAGQGKARAGNHVTAILRAAEWATARVVNEGCRS
ncbi:MAG: 4-hydroxythreonine-4-phosphate dehydrogenase [Planctomycetota bacterium]|jgi:4-hydroxythreonine-4-phosphate dehydrogenase